MDAKPAAGAGAGREGGASMQLRQLEIFLAVARNSSFSKAAEALFLAQPTVSSHVRALEEELHARLFVRSTKGLELTPEGRLFYTYASQIVHFCERAKAELGDMAEEKQNRLLIAASTVPAQYLLPEALPAVKRRYPKTVFIIRQGDSASAVQAVLNGEAEIGVVGDRVERPELSFTLLCEERLVIAAPNTPYFRALHGELAPEELRQHPFLMRESGSGTRRIAEALLGELGVQPDGMQIAAELSGTEGVLRCVESGLGLAVVSGMAAARFAAAGKLLCFPVDSPSARRRFYAVTREDVPLTAAASYVVETLQKRGAAGGDKC